MNWNRGLLIALTALLIPAAAVAQQSRELTTVTGNVLWDGEVPELPDIRVVNDEFFCSSANTRKNDLLEVNPETRGIHDAIVMFVPRRTKGATYQTSRPVEVEFKSCSIYPANSFAPAHASITMLSRDPVYHEVIILAENGKQVRTLSFPVSGVPQKLELPSRSIFTLTCRDHPWEIAAIAIPDTPFVAQTDSTGRFEMAVPAGDYHFYAWHHGYNLTPIMSKGTVVGYHPPTPLVSETKSVHVRRNRNSKFSLTLRGPVED